MPTIKPFRDYDEHEVINLFAFDGSSATKGTFVKIATGWDTAQELSMYGPVGASYVNTVSERYGVQARVTTAASGDLPIGLLLRDVRETDENGEKLIFNPRKAAEMNVCISGQAVPILRRGVVLYSGITTGTTAVVPGNSAFVATNGALNTTGFFAVGRFLGAMDSKGFALVEVNL